MSLINGKLTWTMCYINAVLFIGLKNAFDTIDHNILLQKLTCYGFSGEVIDLFRNYLSDRTQITVINNIYDLILVK